jgi:CrcB protein
MGYLIVFLGGGIGAALRHGFNLASARLLGNAFPYATLFENVSGSVVMGVLVGYFAFKGGITQHWQLFMTTGILGGYTTFSTFSLDVALLMSAANWGWRRFMWHCRSRCRLEVCSRVSPLCATSSSPSPAGRVYRAAPCHGRGLDSGW